MPNNMFGYINPYDYNNYLYELKNKIMLLEQRITSLEQKLSLLEENESQKTKSFEYQTSMNMM